MLRALPASLAVVALLFGAAPAEAKRTRVLAGAQVGPRYPGAKRVTVFPLFGLARAKDGETFAFSSPDQSSGFTLLAADKLQIGPVFNFQAERRSRDVGGKLPSVGFSVELGGFVQYQIAPALRLRAEARKGVSGHEGTVGSIGADYIARDADNWLFSVGPRLTLSDGRYQRAYYGVTPAAAVASGLPAFRPGGGVEAVGGAAGVLRQVSKRVGVYGFAKYDRLVGDAARSPVVRRYGSPDQLAGGLGLTYTFGR